MGILVVVGLFPIFMLISIGLERAITWAVARISPLLLLWQNSSA